MPSINEAQIYNASFITYSLIYFVSKKQILKRDKLAISKTTLAISESFLTPVEQVEALLYS